MKRAFFFGLGVSLILVGITRILFWQPVSVGYDPGAGLRPEMVAPLPRWGSIAVMFISMLASGIAIWAAKHSPPSHSWMIAILFWMLGYLATGFLLAPFVVAFVLLGHN